MKETYAALAIDPDNTRYGWMRVIQRAGSAHLRAAWHRRARSDAPYLP
jgi:hypothetical protein